MTAYDAVVVGAGPNGLVGANLLADAGWSVLVLEAQDVVGGAVKSAEDVHPGFVHDTFSSFYPLSAASRTLRDLRLEEHGLRWRHAPAVLGHPRLDGSWAMLFRDRERTAAHADAEHPGDGERWLAWCREWDVVGEGLVGALLTPFPPVRPGLSLAARLPQVGGLAFVRKLLTSAAEIGAEDFTGDDLRLLLAGNAAHADIPLTAPGSGLMGLLLCMLGQTVGFPVPEGGAGRLAAALADRFTAHGGEIRCGAVVEHVDVRGGRVVGVRTADGGQHQARRAVLADVVAPHLFGGLVAPEDLPDRIRKGMRSFRLDPSTVKVDWALSGPVPWRGEPPAAPGTVHVGDSVEEMSVTLAQVASGFVPARPMMLVGQMSAADPTRSPEGTEALWSYSHVPQRVVGDAGDEGITGRWDHGEIERFADRMQARLERLAPGFGDRILARRVLGPHELEARDANLVGGAVNGGTAQLYQQLIFRPVPGWGRAETGIRGLYLASASAHPGGGVHGGPGQNAARAALLHARLRRI